MSGETRIKDGERVGAGAGEVPARVVSAPERQNAIRSLQAAVDDEDGHGWTSVRVAHLKVALDALRGSLDAQENAG